MEKNMNQKKDDNLTILATKLNTEDAEAFREIARQKGTTVSRLLSDYIRSVRAEQTSEANPTGTNTAVLTYRNVDRLKHEVAFHNPRHFNPDEMLNHILNQYFKMVAEVRVTSEKI
jgi:type IV secretory pathway VirD2 relaxase